MSSHSVNYPLWGHYRTNYILWIKLYKCVRKNGPKRHALGTKEKPEEHLLMEWFTVGPQMFSYHMDSANKRTPGH